MDIFTGAAATIGGSLLTSARGETGIPFLGGTSIGPGAFGQISEPGLGTTSFPVDSITIPGFSQLSGGPLTSFFEPTSSFGVGVGNIVLGATGSLGQVQRSLFEPGAPEGGTGVNPIRMPEGGSGSNPIRMPEGGTGYNPIRMPEGGTGYNPIRMPEGGTGYNPIEMPEGGTGFNPIEMPEGGTGFNPEGMPGGGLGINPEGMPGGGLGLNLEGMSGSSSSTVNPFFSAQAFSGLSGLYNGLGSAFL